MLRGKVICLDPGHSGTPDPGVCGRTTQEAALAWELSQNVKRILETRWNAKVILTKTAQNDPKSDSLSYRCDIANTNRADIFCSIHLNGAVAPSATGTETYHTLGSLEGRKLANSIQGQLVACLRLPDRGIKSACFAVLVGTSMPAVLVEVGFLSNPVEEQFLIQKASTSAEAIAQGLVDYLVTRGKGW